MGSNSDQKAPPGYQIEDDYAALPDGSSELPAPLPHQAHHDLLVLLVVRPVVFVALGASTE